MGNERKIACCTQHVDIAIDVIVDDYEVAPNIVEISSELSTTCEYCEDKATYMVSNIHSSTRYSD